MHKSIIVGILLAGASLPVAASAQSNVEGRVGKLESEMRAVQRKVFPGGAGQLLQPEVTGPQATAGPGPGTPATSAVADLAQRVTSLEQQIASMTGQVEQTEYKIRQLQEQFDAYRRATDDRMKLIEAARTNVAPGAAGSAVEGTGGPDEDAGPPARPSGATAAARPANAVEKPSTGNPAEDEYLYGYRLWAAKSYAEAQTQLKKVVATYPKDRRASYAQNLLGRAYLDEGKPSLASMAFYDNYKKMPDGERASESLYYLGQSLTKLNKSADACKVYDELNDVYGAKLSRDMTAKVAAGRAAAKCK
jgi:TolA-binding protein